MYMSGSGSMVTCGWSWGMAGEWVDGGGMIGKLVGWAQWVGACGGAQRVNCWGAVMVDMWVGMVGKWVGMGHGG